MVPGCHETFGDDIANELVEWFNMIDATYRSELRELNELNYARFESKLEQRTAELESRMDAGFERLRAEMVKWFFLFWLGMVVTLFISRAI